MNIIPKFELLAITVLNETWSSRGIIRYCNKAEQSRPNPILRRLPSPLFKPLLSEDKLK